ncbi:MAG: histidine phosphatase family protein [Pseudomonadota bacterium]
MNRICKVIPALLLSVAVAGCAEPGGDGASASRDAAPVIYIMRHTDKAASPETRAAAPAGYDPAECEMRTGLSAAGAARAGAVAEALSDIDFAASYSSAYCRTAHAAHIVSGLAPSTSLTDPDAGRAAFIAGMTEEARQAGGPILLVMHSNWIGALFSGDAPEIDAPSWAAPQCYGDVRAFRLDGERWVYAGGDHGAVTDRQYYECENGHTG